MQQSTYNKLKQIPLEKKQKEINNLKLKYPNRIPVIVYTSNSNNPPISKSKFLVESSMSMANFMAVLKNYIKIDKSDAIFLFTEKNTLIPNSWQISNVYYTSKNEDGFLYIEYCLENTFG
jgi:GABA(A) receptor-associated protein